jgi:hypothetical protein
VAAGPHQEVAGLDARALLLQWQAGKNKEVYAGSFRQIILVMGAKKEGMTCGWDSKDNC